jgi:HSP20 family molecular chaperone IbpA
METQSMWHPWQEMRRLQREMEHLPPGLALDRAEARVKRGVLTVTIPKATERPDTRHIPIKT